MTGKNPSIYGHSVEYIEDKVKYMKMLGYTIDDIIKMTKLVPFIYSLSIDNMQKKINDMELLGFKRVDIVKMTRNAPVIYNLNISNIREKMENIMKLGYTNDEILYMFKKCPSMYSIGGLCLIEKFNLLLELGYKYEDVIKITSNFPNIYGLTIENIRNKKEFYDIILISSIFIVKPMYLMQSVELSYARYMYLKSIGVDIDMNNYKGLFLGQKEFINKYGKSNKDLIELYKYSDYLDNLNNSKNRVLN